MEYLAYLDKKNDDQQNESLENQPVPTITKDQPSIAQQPVSEPEEQNRCLHNQIYGHPSDGGFCLECDENLTSKQMGNNYRQFGLMDENEKIYTRNEYGIELIQKRKAELISRQKLVLVLDLDNTLLHATYYNPTPEMLRHPSFAKPGCHLMDSEKLLWHIFMPREFSYQVKLRPFLREFLRDVMEFYEIYFYTAATRKYGSLILKLLHQTMTQFLDKSKRNNIDQIFNPDKRLIAREDGHKYTAQQNSSLSKEEIEYLQRAELNAMNGNGSLNIQRLKHEFMMLNYCTKKLSALAGDDTIFVVLDDRRDVWTNERTKRPIDNLIQIQPYFYHDESKNPMFTDVSWSGKLVREIAQQFDFDLCLPIHVLKLKKIHEMFFDNYSTKPDELKDTKFCLKKIKRETFSLEVVRKQVSFEKLCPGVDMTGKNEAQLCDYFGLARTDKFSDQNSDQSNFQKILLQQINQKPQSLENCTDVSAYWFYYSMYFNFELPIEPFIVTQNTQPNLCFQEQVKDLLLGCLESLNFQEYLAVYQKMVRNKQKIKQRQIMIRQQEIYKISKMWHIMQKLSPDHDMKILVNSSLKKRLTLQRPDITKEQQELEYHDPDAAEESTTKRLKRD